MDCRALLLLAAMAVLAAASPTPAAAPAPAAAFFPRFAPRFIPGFGPNYVGSPGFDPIGAFGPRFGNPRFRFRGAQDQQDRLREWQQRQDEVLRQRERQQEERQRLSDSLLQQRLYDRTDAQLHRGRLQDERQNSADQRLNERQHLHDDLLLDRQFQQSDRQHHRQALVDERQNELDQRLNEHQELRDYSQRERESQHEDGDRQREQLSQQRQRDRERADREREQEQQRREREREREQQEREKHRRWRREDTKSDQDPAQVPAEVLDKDAAEVVVKDPIVVPADDPVVAPVEVPVEDPVGAAGSQVPDKVDDVVRAQDPAEESESAVEAKSYSGSQLWRVEAGSGKLNLQRLVDDGLVQTWYSNSSVWDVLVSPDRQEYLRGLLAENGLEFSVMIPDMQRAIADENPALSEEDLDELTGRKGHRMTWQHYHRAADMHGYLDYLAQTFPDVCEVTTIGSSVEGRPLKVLRLKGRPGSPAMWIDGGIHAREWITSASVTYMINELIENRAAHESWLSGVDMYILPLANPDGYEYTHVRDRLWRKNRRRNGGQCDGVDLNRNFGYKWGGQGTSAETCKEIYRGSSAFSEPETTAIKNFVLSKKSSLKSYLSFHSYGQYVLHPWGYDRFVPPDHLDLKRVGNKIAGAMRGASGLSYSVGSSSVLLYPAAGASDDWAKGVAGVKYAYTVELRDTGRYGFVLPAQYIVNSGQEVVAAVKALATEVAAL